MHLHYPGDDLLAPLARRRGLPIGNLTSQFFANVYLDGLDHFCKEVLRAEGYLRYTASGKSEDFPEAEPRNAGRRLCAESQGRRPPGD